ncbi:MAG: bifunctional methylenetetrahydrofolate dehydrogenase/methenyltetrahydrofolate cyclohydrolase FolD [marine benthic group bacterium]|jgi:methylenetetrahydrofolate dehydrogenase (NADP+)/methenyltetrahydrofolate cyclohydrolase|nr:bifunctional methylenetetrahydrofolate dehydrogenase/methenyltetrahydrofolate cyclohydrolase FolD [Gemmatimonadota bacterium]MCL7961846.1 bifunctional methylenetetrahydrofolate dehydrogenase/methenyltetrahydrofolate cyclohydrolase FolD [Candidatus Carthagonibacter metallireducens]MCL7937588.1 bifunctional methylenetetrahydrofolate dehydrogenase/methenyltetrahydrofolate cyclohydrolase FolD [Gemmatimonadota bacterium]MCL7958135.1 bifunctional methylenetetrahydrofolate dehydrogenase/methenyltetr
MTAKIIDGNAIAASVREDVKAEATALREKGIEPCLAVMLVGEDPASRVYVGMKEKKCAEVGIRNIDARLPAETSQEEILRILDEWNADPSIHGILVQLPLPDHVDESTVTERILPEKDVDGFHPVNVGRMSAGDTDAFRPCTPHGVQVMLKHIGWDPSGKHAVVVGRSNIVGRPMATILSQKQPWANATVTVAHSRSDDLAGICRLADLLIVAVGRPESVTGDMVKEGAVVIDVGVNRVDDPEAPKGYRLVGDVAFEEAKEVASWITPVPGGVGPMTIAMLLQNTVTAAGRSAGTS